jgi:RNA recognition motif-containing protein
MNIYVANLHYRLNDEDLHQIFSDFGEVTSAKVIKDHETGRSRGFWFLVNPNKE